MSSRSPERASEVVNGGLQALGGGRAALSAATVAHKVEQASHHLDAWEQFRARDAAPPRVLEVGTGWFPLVPLHVRVRRRHRAELNMRGLTTPGRIRAAAGAVASLADGLGERADRDRVDRLRHLGVTPDADVAARLGDIHVSFHTGRVTTSSVMRDSFDVAISDNTLEHVPPAQIHDLCVAMAAAVGAGGVIDHFVDASDHYAHFDHSITEYNFLRWDDRAWRLINNRLLYQNRLRQADYMPLLEGAGLRVRRVGLDTGPPG